jgi:hypothetical protein
MNNAESSKSFLSNFWRAIGIGVLFGSSLFGCYSKHEKPAAKPRVVKSSLEDKAEEKSDVKPSASKRGKDVELGIGYSRQESQNSISDSSTVQLKNRSNLGDLRWQVQGIYKQNSDSVQEEWSANGDFYVNNSGKVGVGLGVKGGNKEVKGSAAGHVTLGKMRINGQVYAGARNDENSFSGVGSETKSISSGGAVNAQLKINRKNNITLGINQANADFEYETTGATTSSGTTLSEANTKYLFYSGSTGDKESKIRSGYIGALASEIKTERTESGNPTEEDTKEDSSVIGGCSIKTGSRHSLNPRFIAGSQNGLGLDFIIGPNTSGLSNLYSQLEEIRRTQGSDSEAFKNLVEQLRNESESVNSNVFSLYGQADDETMIQNYEFKYARTWGDGRRLGLGVKHTIIPSDADTQYLTYITLNCEFGGKERISIDAQVLVDGEKENWKVNAWYKTMAW